MTMRLSYKIPWGLVIWITRKAWNDSDIANHLLYNAYTPWLEITTEKIGFHIEEIQSDVCSFWENEKEIKIYNNFNQKLYLDTHHLLYSLSLEWFRSNNLLSLHSSCVDSWAWLYLIVGNSWSGKTTTALDLVKSFAYKFYSWNKTLIEMKDSKIFAIAWTPTVTIRQEDLEKYDNPKGYDYYWRRAFRLPEHNYSSWKKEINKIIFIKTITWINELNKLSHDEAIHKTYPFLFDKTNSDCVIQWWKDLYVAKIRSWLERELLNKFMECSKEIDFYQIVWSQDFIINQIKGLW